MSANEHQVGGDHYKAAYQHWDLVVDNNIPYLESQCTKYLSRWRKKTGAQDVQKAIHYLEKLQEGWKAGKPYRTGALRVSRQDVLNFFLQEGSDLGILELGIFNSLFYAETVEELDYTSDLLNRLYVRAKIEVPCLEK